ncbi:hypothetical protein [Aquimarina algiphila]|uniref:hypothetical protein n=1 Tax=Aquimarina algiphila TaxID=2047982 RepID=UPI00232C2A7F|nr:hypothetical protein [Aquimarina algiphila]
MNKITYTIVLLCFVQFGFSQTDNDYQTIITTISEGYNAKDANKIFSVFSADLQSTFSLDKVKSFIEENHASKGAMSESTLLVEEDGNRRYLTEFENASSVLVLGLSSDNKVKTFALEEY